MPHLPGRDPQKTDALSVFTLGIFSGITSACCAPVLIGILTLTFLSGNFFNALAIGGMYVLGMVMPLLFISVFLAGKVKGFTILRKSLISFNFIGKKRTVFVGSLIASIIFLFTGILILILNATGRLGMEDVNGFTKMITDSTMYVNQYVGGNLVLNLAFVALIIYIFYRIAKKI